MLVVQLLLYYCFFHKVDLYVLFTIYLGIFPAIQHNYFNIIIRITFSNSLLYLYDLYFSNIEYCQYKCNKFKLTEIMVMKINVKCYHLFWMFRNFLFQEYMWNWSSIKSILKISKPLGVLLNSVYQETVCDSLPSAVQFW